MHVFYEEDKIDEDEDFISYLHFFLQWISNLGKIA